jgi:hypothetical protein
MMELVFVSAPGCSAFMVELLEVVADAVRRSGGSARCATGLIGALYAEHDSVFVVVPHEYLAIDPDPPAWALQRTIAFGVEHPGTTTYQASVAAAGRFAAVVEINDASMIESARRGLRPQRFVLGHSPLWEHSSAAGSVGDRGVEVLHMGTLDIRRAALLASYAEDLATSRTRLLLAPHEPMTETRPYFVTGRDKQAALAGSKVLLNLHREGSRALEWVRVLEALVNGCAVVSEHSVSFAPLEPGVHIHFGHARSLGALAAHLARDPAKLETVRERTRELLANELDMTASAAALAELAAAVSAAAASRHRPRCGAPPEPGLRRGADAPPMAEWMPVASAVERVPEPRGAGSGAVDAGDTAASLVVRRWSAAAQPRDALRGGRAAVHLPVGISSGDGPLGMTLASLRDHAGPWELTAARAQSRGAARNAAAAEGEAPWLAVLDAGDAILPGGLDRLMDDVGSDVDVVIGIAAHAGGLLNALPPDPRRLRIASYLSRGYLVRRSFLDAIGGWSEDPLLEGMTDHDFFVRALECGGRWRFTPSIVVRLWRQAPSLRPVDVDSAPIWELLNRRLPAGPEVDRSRIPVR